MSNNSQCRGCKIFATSILISSIVMADITGTVYRDYNMNTTQDNLEPGIEALEVKAYDSNDTIVTTSTDASGAFTLTTGAGNYRVEITKPTYLYDTSDGASSDKSSTFTAVDGENGIKIGLHNPAEYISSNAQVLAVTFAAGKRDTNPIHPTLRLFPYEITSGNNDENAVSNISALGETGATWGLAYDKSAKKAYTSAVVRRYMDASPDGIGSVYVTDLSDTYNPSTTLFTTVANVGTILDTADRNFTTTHLSHDPVLEEVGNTGLGDLDISEDGTKLYTINLNTQELMMIDIETKKQTTYAIANPFGTTCPDADVRSWGLKPHDGAVYIGSVCSTNMAVGSAVSKWDGGSFTTVITTPLDYTKGKRIQWADQPNGDDFSVWNSDAPTLFDGNLTDQGRQKATPQPILSDIAFTEENGMVLGYTDRLSFLTGYKNYGPDINDNTLYQQDGGGDILRVCKVNGMYYNEGNVNCPQHIDNGYNEFFVGEKYIRALPNYIYTHNEIALGALAYKQGSGNIATIAYDPNNGLGTAGYDSSGVTYLDMITGVQTGGQLLNGAGTAVGRAVGLAKAGGMGDIEFLSDPASIEIGNYVWEDLNKDGIQDPNEAAIPGVIVKLYEAGTEVGTATTDANGHYYFGGLRNTNMTGSNPLKTNTEYEIKIALNDAALGGKVPTVQDANTNSEDQRDSDGDNGVIDPLVSTITHTTGNAGQNNHNLDFGFVPPESTNHFFGTHFWLDSDADGVFDATEKPIDGAKVELFDSNGTKIDETTTANGGEYGFDVPAGTYQVKFHIPDTPEYEGYVFSKPNNNTDNNLNINKADTNGFTQSVTVGPGVKAEDLTLDAGINCGCSNVSTDSVDAQTLVSMLAMMLFTLMTGLFFERRCRSIPWRDCDRCSSHCTCVL